MVSTSVHFDLFFVLIVIVHFAPSPESLSPCRQGSCLVKEIAALRNPPAALNLAFHMRQLDVGHCFPKFYGMSTVIRKKGFYGQISLRNTV